MESRLSQLRAKYDESTLLALDPTPIQEKARNPLNQSTRDRYGDWASPTSEDEGEEIFNPRAEYEQDRARYEPIPVCA